VSDKHGFIAEYDRSQAEGPRAKPFDCADRAAFAALIRRLPTKLRGHRLEHPTATRRS
jgi:hypothetical protein